LDIAGHLPPVGIDAINGGTSGALGLLAVPEAIDDAPLNIALIERLKQSMRRRQFAQLIGRGSFIDNAARDMTADIVTRLFENVGSGINLRNAGEDLAPFGQCKFRAQWRMLIIGRGHGAFSGSGRVSTKWRASSRVGKNPSSSPLALVTRHPSGSCSITASRSWPE
jgi:hypothetical protein